MSNNAAVSLKNVSVHFKGTEVLKTVSADWDQGLIHGVIGRNGSGKTVLFKAICGFIPTSAGDILVNNARVTPSSPPLNLGIMIDSPGFIPTLDAYRNLKLLSKINKKLNKSDILRLIEFAGLEPLSKKTVNKYSKGMLQRLGIAQSIMDGQEILILDEPMDGLDKQGVLDVRNLLKSLKESGKTIILSSHNSEDIDTLCDTVCEMDAGVLTRIR